MIMPGPGGGGHGGGGSRGGGFGGGRPGGFGGGSRPPYGGFGFGGPRGPRFGFGPRWGMGYHRPYYGGGGCLGGLLGIVMVPVVLLLVITTFFGNAISSLFGGGGITYVSYDENTFQAYADTCYAEEFGNSTAYEDNILLVFLTDEECYDYYYIAWVGDHIETDINYLFGNNQTALGRAILANVNQSSYMYSLDSNLAQVVKQMAANIEAQSLASSFTCKEDHVQVRSHLTNKTDLPLTEEAVNEALVDFTEKTGIPMVIVVDDMTDVFGRNMSGGSPLTSVLGVVLIVIVIVLAVYFVKRKKSGRQN